MNRCWVCMLVSFIVGMSIGRAEMEGLTLFAISFVIGGAMYISSEWAIR